MKKNLIEWGNEQLAKIWDQRITEPLTGLGGATRSYYDSIHQKDKYPNFFSSFQTDKKVNCIRVSSIVAAPFTFMLDSLKFLITASLHLLNAAWSLLNLDFSRAYKACNHAIVDSFTAAAGIFVAAISPFTNALDVIGGLSVTAVASCLPSP